MKKIKDKYHVQVALTDREYEDLRKMAFEQDVTVNQMLRILIYRSKEKERKK